MTDSTKVVFRKFQGEIVALFPEEPGTYDPATCSSYAQIGQHSVANYYDVIVRSSAATDAEASQLKAELQNLGYKLEVFRRSPSNAYQTRKAKIRAM